MNYDSDRDDGKVVLLPVDTCSGFYKEISNVRNTDKNTNDNPHGNLINGFFLYTDEDSEIVDYLMNNYEAFDKLTGDWCCIYVLEKKGIKWEQLKKYWKNLLFSELHDFFRPLNLVSAKPFNRNDC